MIFLASAFSSADVGAQDSPLMTGDTADMWIVDSETGQVTGYDTGRWMEQVNPAEFSLIDFGDSDVFLINLLKNSSEQMIAGQPEISLVGLGDAALKAGEGGEGGHRDLRITPTPGSYRDTIAVNIGVSSSLLADGPHTLSWTAIERGSAQTVTNASVALPQNAGGLGENGYHTETFFLVNSGVYELSVQLQGAGINQTVVVEYDLAIAAGRERRDTDGDGIPDAVEIDMGLNPLEDDWLADKDGNGWSEFDEWLRRFCLDPVTQLPLDADAPCLDADGLPLDTDADNWSDFDEIIRGTNYRDPEPQIPPQQDAPDSEEYVALQRLRFKDFPAANRLYEVEHLLGTDAGVLNVPGLANLLPDQQTSGSADSGGIQVHSYAPGQDNIAGIDLFVAASGDELDGVEDIYLNIWADAVGDGELLLAQKIDDVVIDGDPTNPIYVRFEPVAVQPGQSIFFEFRKKDLALAGASFEVFYDATFANGIGGTRAGFQWWTVGGIGLDGALAYDATLLLHDAEITAAGLVPNEIAPRRRMTTLGNALATSRLPEMRLPAGNSLVLDAVHRHSVPAQTGWRVPADYSRLYKKWLPRTDDVTPRAMLDEMGEGSWTTPEEWRREFISYLLPRLVVPLTVELDIQSTLEVSIIEAALSEEARLDGSGGVQVIDGIFQPSQPIYSFQPEQPLFGDLGAGQSPFVADWEDNLERLSVTDFNLDHSIVEVRSALAAGQPLEPLGNWLREKFYAGVPGSSSDSYMVSELMIAFPDVCKVPTVEIAARQADIDAWNDFLDQCPVWVDDAGYATAVAEMQERCYLVRLNLLPGALPAIGDDATLADRQADSDTDGVINLDEIEVPVRQVTLPWEFDTDGDGLADLVDDCPNDPFNQCSDNPILPVVTLDADFEAAEPASGSGFALVSVQLGRLYDEAVTVCYEAVMDVDDTATPDVDFGAVSACVTIAPGQLSALIRVPINADSDMDAGETFTVRITTTENAVIGDDGQVVVTLLDTAPAANNVPVFTSGNTATVAEGTTATGYFAAASDADGDTLSFSISGGTDAALFVIDGVTGELRFIEAPAFDLPADANADNNYELQLSADDGRTGIATLDLVVTVTASQPVVRITFPTPNANLGGGITSTRVTGSVTDSTGADLPVDAVSSITVNGVAALIDRPTASHWRWDVEVAVAEGSNTLSVSYQLADNSTASFDVAIDNTPFYSYGNMEVDTGNNRVIALEGITNSLVAIDLASKSQSVVSGGNGSVGSGIVFNSPRDVALDLARNRALVADWNRDAVIAVNLTNGDRSYLSDSSTGTGPLLDGAQSLALDAANNRVLVAGTIEPLLFAVDILSGDRSILSGGSAGSGPALTDLRDVVVDAANGRAFVFDGDLDAVFEIDLANGDRTIVSDAVTGSGPDFGNTDNMALDAANNRLMLAGIGGYVISVDLASGDREVFVDARPAFEVNKNDFRGIAIDAANNDLLVADSRLDQIFAYNLTNPARTVLVQNSAGSGPESTVLYSIQGLAYDPASDRLVMTRSGVADSVITVDMADAGRQTFSDDFNGAGPTFNFPQRPDIDTSNNRALFAANSDDAIYSVDLTTGDRARLSDNQGIGSGTLFGDPWDVSVVAGGDEALVLDNTAGVMRVDLVSGDRQVESGPAQGNGPIWSYALSIEVNEASNEAYVLDYTTDALYSVDLANNGDRTIVSDNTGIGTGINFNIPYNMDLDAANNRLWYADYGADVIATIDLVTGDRTVIADNSSASSVPLSNPYYIALDLANDRIFVYDIIVTGVIVIDLSSGQRAIASKY
tara:strand:- start:9277 stop:14652 length:5376 start_codon:yes stop_codon:yes gene_type:complete